MQIAAFTLTHHTGLPVTFTPTGASMLPDEIAAVSEAIDAALAAGWTTGVEGADDGKEKRLVTIHGWVYGKSANQNIPVVWLYSNNHPYLTRKVTQVYGERMSELPITIPQGLKPIKGAAPEKKVAIDDGDYNECAPFVVELADTGEKYLEHPVFRFVRVVGGAQTQPTTQAQKPQQASGVVLDAKTQALVEFEALGTGLHAASWQSVRRDIAARTSQGTTNDPEQLNADQLRRLVDGLKTAHANRARVIPPPNGKPVTTTQRGAQ
jgi:hypothetical protein